MKLNILALSLFFLLCSQGISAQIAIEEITVKKPIPGQTVGAGYFSLSNPSEGVRVLVDVSSSSAERVEMHTHVHEQQGAHGHATMKMVKVDDVEIPAKSVFRFEPGKHHLMLFSPSEEALSTGEIDLVFLFKNGETVKANAAVESW